MLEVSIYHHNSWRCIGVCMPAPTDSLHLCEDWLMVIYSTLICCCLFVYFLRLRWFRHVLMYLK